MQTFRLPRAVADLVAARNRVREHYAILAAQGTIARLHFTFDGNLVGDLGEALAVELFGIRLVEAKATEAIDGYAPDGRPVQVKATTTARGPAFRRTALRADHLLFFDIDLAGCNGTVIYNGPEHQAFALLPEMFEGQRSLSPARIRAADLEVASEHRLPMIGQSGFKV